jgi:hypothetical protein
MGLYAHLAKDDQMAKSYLNMALTESKTYYGKAWENLEAVSGVNGNTTSSRNDDKQIVSSKTKDNKKTAKKPIVAAQPVAAPAPIAQKKEEPKAEEKPVTPTVVDQSVSDAPKDGAPKADEQKTETEGGLMQLLGTAKSDDAAPAKIDVPAPATTTIPAPAETKIIPTDKPIAPAVVLPVSTSKLDETKAKPANGTVGILGTIPAADLK